MSIETSCDLRRLLQGVDRSRPVAGLFEVVNQLGRDFLHPLGVQGGQTLANDTMQSGSASGWLPVIENLAIQHMREGVALGHAAVGESMGAHPFHDVMPAGQLLVEICQTVRILVGSGADHARAERGTRDTRQLQGAVLWSRN